MRCQSNKSEFKFGCDRLHLLWGQVTRMFWSAGLVFHGQRWRVKDVAKNRAKPKTPFHSPISVVGQLCCVVCWLLSGVGQIVHGGETVRLQGYVIYSSMPNGLIENGKIVPQSAMPRSLVIGQWTNSFSIKISADGSWMMEISPVTTPKDLMYGKKQVIYQTYDKTNIYGAYYSEGVTRNRRMVDATNLTSLEHFADISAGDYPAADLNMLPNLNVQFTPNILWLAFGSSDFFKRMVG